MGLINQLNSRIKLTLLSAAVLLGTTFGLPMNASGQSAKPKRIKAIGYCDKAVEVVKQAYETCERAKQSASQGRSIHQSKGKLREVAKAYGETAKLWNRGVYYAKILKAMGEPAAFDIENRNQQIFNTLEGVRRSPLGNQLQGPAKQFRDADEGRLVNELRKCKKLFQDGKVEEAEAALWAQLDIANSYGYFLQTNWRQGLEGKLDREGDRSAIENTLLKKRRAGYQQELTERFDEQKPDLDTLFSDCQAAIDSIKNTGSATVNEVEMSGPEAFKHFYKKFQEANFKLVRCRGIAISLDKDEVNRSAMTELVRLTSKWKELLPEIILASRTSDLSKIESLYVDYLRAIANTLSFSSDEAFVLKCSEALDTLAKSNENIQASARNYHRATSDLLLWKGKFAESKSKLKAEQFVDLRTKSKKEILEEPLTTISKNTTDNLLNRTVHVQGVTRRGDFAFVPLNEYGFWARVMGLEGMESEVTRLKKELLVDSEFPPLSIKAAMALSAGIKFQNLTIGGTVTGVDVESAVTRAARLPKKAMVIAPLGSSVGEEFGVFRPDLLLTRVDIRPQWVQHPYFFAELSSN